MNDRDLVLEVGRRFAEGGPHKTGICDTLALVHHGGEPWGMCQIPDAVCEAVALLEPVDAEFSSFWWAKNRRGNEARVIAMCLVAAMLKPK